MSLLLQPLSAAALEPAAIVIDEPLRSPEIEWVTQFGTTGADSGTGIAVDRSEGVYLTGELDNQAFVTKFTFAGEEAWSHTFGSGKTIGLKINVDSADNVIVAGQTRGSVQGTNAGFEDMFVVKYAPSGEALWATQLGTSGQEWVYDSDVDQNGNTFITGYTDGTFAGEQSGDDNDLFLAKFGPAGDLQWVQQSGIRGDDFGRGLGLDAAGNAYITGRDRGEPFISKYDNDGVLIWKREGLDESEIDGDPEIRGLAVAANGDSYVVGAGYGDTYPFDAVLVKFNSEGTVVWQREFASRFIPGTDFGATDEPWEVVVDPAGSAYVSGYTTGYVSRDQAGTGDAFLLQYSSQGELLLAEQFGTFEYYEYGLGVAIESDDTVYLSGFTYGDFGGEMIGPPDAFLLKLTFPIPEPPALVLVAISLAVLGREWGRGSCV